jgi:hypothetical protein
MLTTTSLALCRVKTVHCVTTTTTTTTKPFIPKQVGVG